MKREVEVRDWGITLMELQKDITPGDAETSRAMEEARLRLMDKTRYIILALSQKALDFAHVRTYPRVAPECVRRESFL